MSERYTKLFSLPENLYTESAPVIISAGSLLKDNTNNKVLTQLKLRNISLKTIKALTLSINQFDTVGTPLGEPVTFQYLDLKAVNDSEFGQQTPIFLSDNKTRAFSVTITDVVFDDNTVWKNTGKPTASIVSQEPLEWVLDNDELVKQYKIEFGKQCDYYPVKDRDLWLCSCGAFNPLSQDKCCRCGLQYDILFNVDIENLKNRCSARLDAERQKASLREEAQAKTNKKITKAVIMIAIVIGLIVITTAVIKGIIVPMHNKNIAYNNAVALLDEGKYKEALTALDELGGYKDSEELKNNTIETIYNKFTNLVDNGKYIEADSYYQEMADCFKLYPNYKKLTEYLAYNSLKIFCTAPTEISVTHDDISGYKEMLTYISDFEDHEQVSDTINTLDKRTKGGFYLKNSSDINQKKEVFMGSGSIDLYEYASIYTSANGSHEYRKPEKSYSNASYITKNGKLIKITFGPYELVLSNDGNSLELNGGIGASNGFAGSYIKE